MSSGDPRLDRLLRAGAPLARRRWAELSEGTLSPDEEDQLRLEAERGEAPEAAFEVLRPLAAEERRALVDAALDQAAASAPPGAPAEPHDVVDRVQQPPRRRRWRTTGTAALATAAAAVIVVGFVARRPGPGPIPHATHRLLLGIDGDDLRGAATSPDEPAITLGPDDALTGQLVPAAGPRSEELEVRVYAVEAGEVRPLLIRQAPPGASTIALGRIPRAALSPAAAAEVRLVIALGAPATLARAASLRDQIMRMEPPGGVELMTGSVRLVAR